MSIMTEVNPCGMTVGIDLAKNVFAVHGVDEHGKAALIKPKVSREQLPALMVLRGFIAQRPESEANGVERRIGHLLIHSESTCAGRELFFLFISCSFKEGLMVRSVRISRCLMSASRDPTFKVRGAKQLYRVASPRPQGWASRYGLERNS